MRHGSNTRTTGPIVLTLLLVAWACVPDAPAGLDERNGADGGDDNETPQPTTGSIVADVSATGVEMPDGFLVTLDDSATVLVPPSSDVTWTGVPPGPHSVTLLDLPPNCGTTVTNPQLVTVEAGAAAAASFPVSCTPTRGELRIVVETTGDEGVDEDGYRIEVEEAGVSERVDVDAELTVPDLEPGSYRVRLRDVNRDCRAAGGRDRTVEVEAGTTTDVEFVVTCED